MAASTNGFVACAKSESGYTIAKQVIHHLIALMVCSAFQSRLMFLQERLPTEKLLAIAIAPE